MALGRRGVRKACKGRGNLFPGSPRRQQRRAQCRSSSSSRRRRTSSSSSSSASPTPSTRRGRSSSWPGARRGRGGGGRRGRGWSVGEGAWRAVQRDPGTLLELLVPFSANYVGCKGIGYPDHDVWLQFEKDAAEDGVTIKVRGRKSNNHPQQYRKLNIYSMSALKTQLWFWRVVRCALTDFDWENNEPALLAAYHIDDAKAIALDRRRRLPTHLILYACLLCYAISG